MINWKDFLYYFKDNRVAIILLMVLICISGGVSMYLNNFSSVDLSYYNQENSVQKEFIEFEENLTETQIVENDSTDIKPDKPKSNKNVSKKLELGQTIDINTASATTLTRIPGIGDTFAERIVEYRNALGGFHSPEQLCETKGITTKKYSQILPYIQIKKSLRKININTIPLEKLSSHPYFNEVYIEIIRKLREEGKITAISQLAKNENFKAKDLERLKPYISY